MRPAMAAVASLLLLLLLAATAQGIRLEEESSGAFQKKLQEKNRNIVGGPERGTPLCSQDGQCSDLRSRKFLTEAKAEPKSTTSEGVEASESSQKLRTEKQEAAGAPSKPAVSEHKKTGKETYPDLMDIAGMDYSPAVRKPPIHN
ncbi:hypothetical protein Taro_032296 [Colocasia esculenta]|uniref:Uncharacterized protein n=1 Tax=Colocasia esculenta TaxID=4460 RepID=A0A843VYV9_COLES|nr:hypothetical protein [Colocasia esculenta]